MILMLEFGFAEWIWIHENAGEDITKDPPVSIPNTVVKLCKPMVVLQVRE